MFNISLDAKGRLAIPTRVREVLEGFGSTGLVVTVDTQDRCLMLYPVSEWSVIETKVQALPSFDARVRVIKRMLLGYATDCEPDGSGRILLGAALREYAGLSRECVLMGQGNKLELWDKARWDGELDRYLQQPMSLDDLPEELKSLSL
ncbi:division/cell wall cluster transcriptional repressor MraZ [Parathalassolituus penaei]|uniref:Transcriptional regulator MraZ n=1 Tax=Parathalassolituus penaei TaxID=2997323 RepID=A0A9X3IUC5_9GAMM|nr:division/cell wall cluster transcriptional repressor MraZ [Parathalassolituus penaei]MCY0966023.1 division/cell wall cluster transcriptional repressor MraZ [Parathalassolituus penaei]